MPLDHLHQLIADNDFKNLFQELSNNPAFAHRRKEILSTKSRWNKFEEDNRLGLLNTDERNKELAIIRKSLLDIIDSPSPTIPTPTTLNKKWFLLISVLFLLIPGFYFFNKAVNSSDENVNEFAANEEAENLPSKIQKPSQYKSWNFKGHKLNMKAQYAGEIEIQIFSMEAYSYNNEQNQVELKFRVKDVSGYGQNFSSSNIRLQVDGKEMAPTNFAVPFIEARTHVDGVAQFLIDKNADQGILIFYFGVVEPITKQEYPLKF